MNNRIQKLKSAISRNLFNIPGWKTRRKIIVFESDDWGSIRMPSREVYDTFISHGFNIAGSDYNRLDCLESDEDLSMLFEVLAGVKDKYGRPAAFTANTIVGNPDFDRIRQSGFSKYYFEPVTDTLERYAGSNKVYELWKNGISENIFRPQFHGREHVNVVRWMEALQKKTPEIMFTFDNHTTFSGNGDYNFMEVLDYNSPSELADLKLSLSEGLDLFQKIFGFRSRSFIPPCYTWNSEVEKTLAEGGVRYIQGLSVQLVPTGSFGNYKRKYHFLGSENKSGQYYLVRNCFFEPSLYPNKQVVEECLKRIDTAFYWNKPAIISSHRINYIGSLDPSNRKNNLGLLKTLLLSIVKNWPEAEFMTTDVLGDMISGEDNSIDP